MTRQVKPTRRRQRAKPAELTRVFQSDYCQVQHSAFQQLSFGEGSTRFACDGMLTAYEPNYDPFVDTLEQSHRVKPDAAYIRLQWSEAGNTPNRSDIAVPTSRDGLLCVLEMLRQLAAAADARGFLDDRRRE